MGALGKKGKSRRKIIEIFPFKEKLNIDDVTAPFSEDFKKDVDIFINNNSDFEEMLSKVDESFASWINSSPVKDNKFSEMTDVVQNLKDYEICSSTASSDSNFDTSEDEEDVANLVETIEKEIPDHYEDHIPEHKENVKIQELDNLEDSNGSEMEDLPDPEDIPDPEDLPDSGDISHEEKSYDNTEDSQDDRSAEVKKREADEIFERLSEAKVARVKRGECEVVESLDLCQVCNASPHAGVNITF